MGDEHNLQQVLETSKLLNILNHKDYSENDISLLDSVDTQVWSLKDSKTYGYCNKAHADFLGVNIEDVEGRNIYSFLKADEAIVCSMSNENVFNKKEKIVIYEELENAHSQKRIIKITKKPILNSENNVEIVICMGEDITHRKELEAQKERANSILYTTIEFTKELLTYKDYNKALIKGISSLGMATDVDRVYYWENHLDKKDNKWYTSQKVEWTNLNVTPEVDNPLMQNLAFEDIWDFIDILSKSDHFNYHVKDIKNDFTREFLAAQEIKSILVLPVIIDDVFIGFIGFDSVKQEKEWSFLEISLLDSFVLLYKKAIERQMLAEKALRVKDNFDSFINTIPDLLIVVDLNGNIVFANDTVFDRLGFTEEELYGNSILLLHPEEFRAEAYEVITKMIQGTLDVCDLPIAGKNGELLYVETKVTKGNWNNEDVYFAVTKDVSELKMSEDKFYKSFNNSGISMFITTIEEDEFLEVNDSFLDLLHLKRDQIIGKTTSQINLYLNPLQKNKIIDDIREKKKISKAEIVINGKNNEQVYGQFNIVPIYLEGRECLLTSMIDITEQKNMYKKVVEAKKYSDRANEAKGQFLSHMSHEIRTPMNAVISYADLLSITDLSTKQHKYVNGIQSSSKTLLNMINDTLDWSKIEKVGLILEKHSFCLDDILESTLDQIRFKSKDKDLDFILLKDETIPLKIIGDPLRLQQVLLNLLSNANKFTEKGQITLKIEVLSSNLDRIEIKFSVTDTGVGIPEKDVKSIFEPFKQSEKTSNCKYAGTGLGIPISKEIVELMGGVLKVKSIENEGSTFYFNAVFNVDKRLELSPSEYPVKEYKQNKKIFNGRRVLVVDDNEINQDVLSEILKTQEIEVTVAGNGHKAIEMVNNLDFEAVLLDLRMPEFDGYQTIEEIRKLFTCDELPVIAITASVSLQEKEKTKLAGFNDYLIKPINKKELFKVLGKWFFSIDNEHDLNTNLIEETSSNELFCKIPEVDIKALLENFDGDESFVYSVLKKFYNNYKNFTNELRHSILINDCKTSSRMAHTLKGLAGELKAYNIYDLALNIEENLLNERDVEESIKILENKLLPLLEFINALDDDLNQTTDIKTANNSTEDIKKLLVKLKKLLLDSDMDCEIIVTNLLQLTKNTDLENNIIKIKSYTDDYDFDKALTVLDSTLIDMVV